MNAGISVLVQIDVKWELGCFKVVVKRWIYKEVVGRVHTKLRELNV